MRAYTLLWKHKTMNETLTFCKGQIESSSEVALQQPTTSLVMECPFKTLSFSVVPIHGSLRRFSKSDSPMIWRTSLPSIVKRTDFWSEILQRCLHCEFGFECFPRVNQTMLFCLNCSYRKALRFDKMNLKNLVAVIAVLMSVNSFCWT